MAEKSVVFCPNPLVPSALVWAASITVTPPLTFEQITHPNVRIQARYSGHLSGPRRGRIRFLRTGTLRFGGSPRGNGTLRRNGTRLLSTITSVFSWRKSARPRTPQWHPKPGVLRLWRRDEAQDDRTRPPNSSSQCFQKLQCFWLQSMDCRFGQYIPVPMAFCAIGYRTYGLVGGDNKLIHRSHYGTIRAALRHVVSHKAIRLFCEEFPDAESAMDHWYRVAKGEAVVQTPPISSRPTWS